MDEQDEGLARLTDLDVTWGFGLHAWRGESPGDPCPKVGESQLTDSQTFILLDI